MKSVSTILAIFFLFISLGCEGAFEQSDAYPFENESEINKSDAVEDVAVESEPEEEMLPVDPIEVEEEIIEDEEPVEEDPVEEDPDPEPDPDVRPEPGSVVMFEIPAGTGDGPWNSFENPVVAYVGQVLLIVNNDNETHQLHAGGGSALKHGQAMGANGGAQDFELNQASPLQTNTPFYDHIDGGRAGFWIEIRP